MAPKQECFCHEMERNQLCDVCEREKFLEQRDQAFEQFQEDWNC